MARNTCLLSVYLCQVAQFEDPACFGYLEIKLSATSNFCRARLRVSETWWLQLLFCVCACVRASARICPDHNLYNNAWISKQFGTVVALEEEKCHLKHFKEG